MFHAAKEETTKILADLMAKGSVLGFQPYGSACRDTYSPISDLDYLVVSPLGYPAAREEISPLLRRIEDLLRVEISCRYLSPADLVDPVKSGVFGYGIYQHLMACTEHACGTPPMEYVRVPPSPERTQAGVELVEYARRSQEKVRRLLRFGMGTPEYYEGCRVVLDHPTHALRRLRERVDPSCPAVQSSGDLREWFQGYCRGIPQLMPLENTILGLKILQTAYGSYIKGIGKSPGAFQAATYQSLLASIWVLLPVVDDFMEQLLEASDLT
jgi:hypothetical protein